MSIGIQSDRSDPMLEFKSAENERGSLCKYQVCMARKYMDHGNKLRYSVCIGKESVRDKITGTGWLKIISLILRSREHKR